MIRRYTIVFFFLLTLTLLFAQDWQEISDNNTISFANRYWFPRHIFPVYCDGIVFGKVLKCEKSIDTLDSGIRVWAKINEIVTVVQPLSEILYDKDILFFEDMSDSTFLKVDDEVAVFLYYSWRDDHFEYGSHSDSNFRLGMNITQDSSELKKLIIDTHNITHVSENFPMEFPEQILKQWMKLDSLGVGDWKSMKEYRIEDATKAIIWNITYEGISFAQFEFSQRSEYSDSKVTIIKIDPAQFDFGVYCETEYGHKRRNAEEWISDFDLNCVINAGMFQTDYQKGCGILKNYDHINNSVKAKDYNMYFACNPINDSLPEAQMIDVDEENAEELLSQYQSILQSIRMMSADGRNVWSKQPNMWSEAALGEDKDGNILLIHCRSPYTMNDFINEMMKLPIGLRKMMHLEGGWEASLIVDLSDTQINKVGSYETDCNENDDNDRFYHLPNVIGVKRK